MKVCPRCASTSVETTTVGYYGLDMNRATCRGTGCGWVGRAHEMATTEAGTEMWERRATEAEAKLEALVKAATAAVYATVAAQVFGDNGHDAAIRALDAAINDAKAKL